MSSRLEETIIKTDVFVYGSPVEAFDDDGHLLSTEQIRKKVMCLATMKNVASALVRYEPQNLKLRLDIGFIKGRRLNPDIFEIAILESISERIFIEYMIYQKSWHFRKNKLVERINSIVFLRSRELSEFDVFILWCCGYFYEPSRSRFGIIINYFKKYRI